MNIRTSLVIVPLLVVIAATTGVSVAYADVYSYNGNNYQIPVGYQSYQGGIFYNPNTGTYYNPVTGQTSTNPLPSVATGTYVVPQGFNPYNADTYYNPSNGMYFNRLTGQTSMYSPTNPATYNTDGTVKVVPGYTYYGSGYAPIYNPVYNPAPIIGQVTPAYTTAAPTIAVTQIMIGNPGLPHTGAGGSAPLTIITLLASAAVVVGGAHLAAKGIRA